MKTTTLTEVPMPLRPLKPLREWIGALASMPLCALPFVLTATLLGCAGSSPPQQLVYLRTPSPAAPAAAAKASALTWQLMLPVRVPDYLDRDAVLVPQGQSGLQAVSGYRWAEPLRESVPRVLRQDLATLLGEARVWTAPVPAGLVLQRQLRVELLALEANAERTGVVLRARWAIVDPAAGGTPRADAVTLDVASKGSDVDSLVAAHREAMWQLAQRIVESAN